MRGCYPPVVTRNRIAMRDNAMLSANNCVVLEHDAVANVHIVCAASPINGVPCQNTRTRIVEVHGHRWHERRRIGFRPIIGVQARANLGHCVVLEGKAHSLNLESA